MCKKILLPAHVTFLTLACFSAAWSLEKLKFATSVRESPVYYLPVLVAEEKGFWGQNGLEGEWVPFGGGPSMYRAVSAGAVSIGFASLSSQLQAVAAGVPVILISDLYSPDDFPVWVSGQSRIKEAKELKRAKVGVSRLGSVEQIYAMIMAKALGFQKDELKFVGTGGISQSLAGLKAGAIDAVVLPINVMVNLKISGEVREVASPASYLPKDWVGFSIFAMRDMVKNRPATVKSAIRTISMAVSFIKRNPEWSLEKMKSFSGFSGEAAKLLYEDLLLRYTDAGKINRKAVENVRDLLVEYGIVVKEKLPPLAELYTDQFVH